MKKKHVEKHTTTSKIDDIVQMGTLITNLLGTCDIHNVSSEHEIIERDILQCEKKLNKYIVAEKFGKIVGLCGISELKTTNIYGIQEFNKHREI